MRQTIEQRVSRGWRCEMTQTYRVVFDRIGRSHDVEPMVFEDVSDPNELAALVFERVKTKLPSREVEVLVNLVNLTGVITVGGFRDAGRFTIEMVDTDD